MFRHESGHDSAINFSKKAYLDLKFGHLLGKDIEHHQILGRRPTFVQAKEPNNIIWENLQIKESENNSRFIVVMMIVAALLLLSFLGIVYLDRQSIEIASKYPLRDCQLYSKTYTK